MLRGSLVLPMAIIVTTTGCAAQPSARPSPTSSSSSGAATSTAPSTTQTTTCGIAAKVLQGEGGLLRDASQGGGYALSMMQRTQLLIDAGELVRPDAAGDIGAAALDFGQSLALQPDSSYLPAENATNALAALTALTSLCARAPQAAASTPAPAAAVPATVLNSLCALQPAIYRGVQASDLSAVQVELDKGSRAMSGLSDAAVAGNEITASFVAFRDAIRRGRAAEALSAYNRYDANCGLPR